jgi:hypothetical protein
VLIGKDLCNEPCKDKCVPCNAECIEPCKEKCQDPCKDSCDFPCNWSRCDGGKHDDFGGKFERTFEPWNKGNDFGHGSPVPLRRLLGVG